MEKGVDLEVIQLESVRVEGVDPNRFEVEKTKVRVLVEGERNILGRSHFLFDFLESGTRRQYSLEMYKYTFFVSEIHTPPGNMNKLKVAETLSSLKCWGCSGRRIQLVLRLSNRFGPYYPMCKVLLYLFIKINSVIFHLKRHI